MHSIIFAKEAPAKTENRDIRITEKVSENGISVYSRRSSSYKVLLKDEQRAPSYESDFQPQMYIYRNIEDKRKLFKWKIVGILKVPQAGSRSALIAYQHSFWMLIKDNC
jgi:hypothetical protein